MKTNIGKRTSASTAAPLPLRIKSILVPIDFSPSSRKAVDYAVRFARQFKAKLTLMHVLEPVALPDFAASFSLAIETDQAMAAAKEQLASGRTRT